MTVTVDDLRSDIEAAFVRAREQLIEARRQQEKKDTPSSRVAVTESRDRIDSVLDLYLEMSPASRP
jgi:hypothetical protein